MKEQLLRILVNGNIRKHLLYRNSMCTQKSFSSQKAKVKIQYCMDESWQYEILSAFRTLQSPITVLCLSKGKVLVALTCNQCLNFKSASYVYYKL